jgi:hypothetical protein
LWTVGLIERLSVASNPGEATEAGIGPSPVLERGIRDEAKVAALTLLEDRDDAIGVGIRQWPDENVVDDAEDRGGAAESEREGEDNDDRKSFGRTRGAPRGAEIA